MENKLQAFLFKLKAANYHFYQMRYNYSKYYRLLEKFIFNDNYLYDQRLHTFFFHFDGFLYELSSCYDMILQFIIIKWSINIPQKNIVWNNKVREILKEKSVTDYLTLVSISEEKWFKDMKIARNHITHRGRPAICGDYDPNNILCLHFCIPGLDDSRCFFKECDTWWDKMFKLSKIFKYK